MCFWSSKSGFSKEQEAVVSSLPRRTEVWVSTDVEGADQQQHRGPHLPAHRGDQINKKSMILQYVKHLHICSHHDDLGLVSHHLALPLDACHPHLGVWLFLSSWLLCFFLAPMRLGAQMSSVLLFCWFPWLLSEGCQVVCSVRQSLL
jgi:hypothetical protein